MVTKRISDYVESKGITLAFLAKKSGVDYEKIYKSFKGNRKLQIDEYMAICEALELDPDTFMGRKE